MALTQTNTDWVATPVDDARSGPTSGLSIRPSAVRSTISLSRAARELFHVLGERLRGELQALDHRKIGEKLIREFLHGHARANGNRCGLNEFARLRCYRLRADQPAPTLLRSPV